MLKGVFICVFLIFLAFLPLFLSFIVTWEVVRISSIVSNQSRYIFLNVEIHFKKGGKGRNFKSRRCPGRAPFYKKEPKFLVTSINYYIISQKNILWQIEEMKQESIKKQLNNKERAPIVMHSLCWSLCLASSQVGRAKQLTRHRPASSQPIIII